MLKHAVCGLFGLVVSCGLASAQSAPVSDRDTQPIAPPHPYYPQKAQDEMKSGKCEVHLDVTAEGIPINIEAVCTDPLFVESAERSMVDVVFAPKIVNGQPVERKGVIYPLEYFIG